MENRPKFRRFLDGCLVYIWLKSTMNNHPSLSEYIASLQFRTWTRFPSDKPETWVNVNGEYKHATILNESFGGLGITMDLADAANMQVGDELTVRYYGASTAGKIEWIQADQATKKMCIGIRWSS